MNRKQLYHRTTDILYNAYYNNLLRFRNNYKCAVTHLIAANMGCPISNHRWQKGTKENTCFIWYDLLMQWNNHEAEAIILRAIGLEEFELQETYYKATGYSVAELVMILQAFESAYPDNDDRPDYFKGLNAVLTVLMEIHQITGEDLPSYSVTGERADQSEEIIDSMVKRHESKTGFAECIGMPALNYFN